VQPRSVLTIAGSDSGGGAGIQADLRTFAARGVHGMTAITAVTAQNTIGVDAVCALEAEMVTAQIRTVSADLPIDAVKTGMLARPATIRAVATLAREDGLPRLVVDPVLVSSTGAPLMEEGGVEAYREALLPHALVVTPNLREAAVLTGTRLDQVRTDDDLIALATTIASMGATWVLVKGGHALPQSPTTDRAPDILLGPSGVRVFDGPRIATLNDHGTGCSTAACVAAELAKGADVPTAVGIAKEFVAAALRGSALWTLGHGHGPIDHMGWGS
jgi:hydroxymethylpyrimidine/phosphomethylpyrimidine kinase